MLDHYFKTRTLLFLQKNVKSQVEIESSKCTVAAYFIPSKFAYIVDNKKSALFYIVDSRQFFSQGYFEIIFCTLQKEVCENIN